MPYTANDRYVPSEAELLYQDWADSLEEQFGDDLEPTEGAFVQAFGWALAQTLAQNQEQSLHAVWESAYIQTADGQALTRKVRELGLERQPAIPATGVAEFTRPDTAGQDYVVPNGTVVQTGGSDPIRFATTEAVTLTSGSTSVRADIEAVQGGEETNVAADTITVMPSPPAGVQSVTNPKPTGDPQLTDTDGDPLVTGQDREGDEELRDRALEVTAIGGAATVPAVKAALLEVNEVRNATIYVNRTDTDNTGSGGLPPTSLEPVVYGGTDADVAEALFDSVGVTAELYGGAHGTSVSTTVASDVLPQARPIEFSRPTPITLDLTVDVVHDDTYVGKTEIKNRIAEFVGGTNVDGEFVPGLGVGDDLLVDELTDVLVGEDTGVIGVSSTTIDDGTDGTDDTTTRSDGLRAYVVNDSQVVETDATDGSITVNETQT